MPLDGCWARAPYLHNGSVPTLWDLLELPDKRPMVFYTGYDVYDPKNVGFVTSGPEAERIGFKFEVCIVGNSNAGHTYGTELRDDEQGDLIECLKTLHYKFRHTASPSSLLADGSPPPKEGAEKSAKSRSILSHAQGGEGCNRITPLLSPLWGKEPGGEGSGQLLCRAGI
jgi:hypothetical protein